MSIQMSTIDRAHGSFLAPAGAILAAGPRRSTLGGFAATQGEIRYSDIANAVGLTMHQKARRPQKGVADTAAATSKSLGKAERMKSQLEWLQAEQQTENDEIKHLETSFSDSQLLQDKARSDMHRQKEECRIHLQRSQAIERKIRRVKEEMTALEQQKINSRSVVGVSSRGSGRGPLASSAGFSRAASSSAGFSRAASSSAGFRSTAPVAGTRSSGLYDSEESLHGQEAAGSMTLEDYFNNAQALRMSADGPKQPQDEVKPLEELSEAQVMDILREVVREEMIEKAGSSMRAWRVLDNSGSGRVSNQDFAPGVSRIGVNWQDLTSFRLDRELFKLFDTQKNGILHFADVFPGRLCRREDPERCSTAEFWGRYCKMSVDVDMRGPKWEPSGPEEELQILHDAVGLREEVADKRKWIAATMRRLKNRGKSDARCREAVALHLPRGTGPKDRDGVQTFSELDVSASRKKYNEAISDPVRNITQVVNELRDQKRTLQNCKLKLYTLTEAPARERQRIAEERQKFSALKGIAGAQSTITEQEEE